MFVMLATSIMFYYVSGILFWASDYLRFVLDCDKDNVTIYFALTSITSPVSGSLLSYPIVNLLGGYTSNYVLIFSFFIGALAAFIEFWLTWYTDYAKVLGTIWAGLFFGGIMLPIFQGVMLAEVPLHLKSKS